MLIIKVEFFPNLQKIFTMKKLSDEYQLSITNPCMAVSRLKTNKQVRELSMFYYLQMTNIRFSFAFSQNT